MALQRQGNRMSLTHHRPTRCRPLARGLVLAVVMSLAGTVSFGAWAAVSSSTPTAKSTPAAKSTTSFGSFGAKGKEPAAAKATATAPKPVVAAAAPAQAAAPAVASAKVTAPAPTPVAATSFGMFGSPTKAAAAVGVGAAVAATTMPAATDATASPSSTTPASPSSPSLNAVTASKTMASDLANSAARKQALDVLDQRRNAAVATGMAAGAIASERDGRHGDASQTAQTTQPGIDPRNPLGIRRDYGTPPVVSSTRASDQATQDALDAAYRMGRATTPTQVIVVNRDRSYDRSYDRTYTPNVVTPPVAMGSRVDDDAAQVALNRVNKPASDGPLPWMGLFMTLLALAAIGGGLYYWWSRKQAAAAARSKRYVL